jgi:hypothetical protein
MQIYGLGNTGTWELGYGSEIGKARDWPSHQRQKRKHPCSLFFLFIHIMFSARLATRFGKHFVSSSY